MKTVKNVVISLVMLFSMLFSLNSFSQHDSVLTFAEVYPSYPDFNLNDLGFHSLNKSDINNLDTLFYIEYTNYTEHYEYSAIVDSISNTNITLRLELLTNCNGNTNIVTLNGVDITGSISFPGGAWSLFTKELTYNLNDTIKFDILKIGKSFAFPFKFSFYIESPTNPNGFNEFFATNKPEFKVYPNPCENILNIDSDGLKRLFDLNGKLLMETKLNKIDMSGFEVGMYFVEIDGVRVKVLKK